MRTLIICVVLALLGCGGPESRCVTYCGMSNQAGGDCGAFETQERLLMDQVTQRGLFDPDRACKSLHGIVVTLGPGTDGIGWKDENNNHERIAGESDCWAGTILVANTRWHSDTNALTHEMMHIMDGCSTPNHEGWATNGYYAAINATVAPDAPDGG